VLYAKAAAHEARRRADEEQLYAREAAQAVPGPPAHLPPESAPWEGDAVDAALERRLRLLVLPLALAVAVVLAKGGFTHLLMRIFFGMWVHEIGHAAAAWLCGFPAFPGPWLTPIASQRSPLFALLLFAGLAAMLSRGLRARTPALAWAGGALLLAQLIGTTVLRPDAARALILFAGDGGMLVLGALLMATLYARPGSELHRGWLRWGFLAIGAASFVDAFEQWWSARTDPDRIPFGMNEGVGLSDPSRLSDDYGWSATQLVSRYVALGCACLLALAVVWLLGLRRPRAGGA
jgi:hypothetical protein